MLKLGAADEGFDLVVAEVFGRDLADDEVTLVAEATAAVDLSAEQSSADSAVASIVAVGCAAEGEAEVVAACVGVPSGADGLLREDVGGEHDAASRFERVADGAEQADGSSEFAGMGRMACSVPAAAWNEDAAEAAAAAAGVLSGVPAKIGSAAAVDAAVAAEAAAGLSEVPVMTDSAAAAVAGGAAVVANADGAEVPGAGACRDAARTWAADGPADHFDAAD